MNQQTKYQIRALALMGLAGVALGVAYLSTGKEDSKGWISYLPPEIKVSSRINYGSTQIESPPGICGAVIYALSKYQTSEIANNGERALPQAIKDRNGTVFMPWMETPVSDNIFARFIYGPIKDVGLNCGHGSWDSEWQGKARASGNFYTYSRNSLIVISANRAFGTEITSMSVGYFYNP